MSIIKHSFFVFFWGGGMKNESEIEDENEVSYFHV